MLLLSRDVKKAILVSFDFLALIAIAWLSFSIRLNTFFVPNTEQIGLIIAAPVIAFPIFMRLGLYRAVLRYLPDRAIWTIWKAVTVAALGWVTLAFLTRMTGLEGMPRSVAVIYWMLAFVVIVGSRFGLKWYSSGPDRRKRMTPTLIYGAGDAGTQLASALLSTTDHVVAGFLSADRNLHGLDIMGARVYPPDNIDKLVRDLGIREIIITMPEPNENRRNVIEQCSGLPVKIRVLPPITDLASGKYLVNMVRDIQIEDILGRSTVPPNPELLHAAIEGKSIFIAGAAGSIGSEVARIAAAFKPKRLVLFDLNEHGMYQISRELRRLNLCEVVPVLGSVCDFRLLKSVMQEYVIDTVYHCAAYKHVNLVEANVVEAVRNNVLGTRTIAEAALESGVSDVVLISSDKAVRPTNIMGATKRWSELIVRHYGDIHAQKMGGTNRFASVRFGNVLGSSGSVVPLFKEQIANGGPVTLTDENMTRYFMSIREAAELIIQGSALAESGDILVLEMGEPVRIRDLAENMILLAGQSVRSDKNPEGEIEIKIVGASEGEKLNEELFYDPSGVTVTDHPRIKKARRQSLDNWDITGMLSELDEALQDGSPEKMRQLIFERIQ
ncbi:nucleoside-diphosphate sugar epimerase/dehydratase [Corticibacterium sp. UT-5YL-CI-8]|nr:nucleoside-diphosphate sugar epimerase/dehydratase [Tianweitania sp. UT-5YL-CI-8]